MKMFKALPVTLVLFFFTTGVVAQRTAPPSKIELEGITQRGRALADYDIAAWHATDAVLELKPEQGSVNRYLARKTDSKWIVVFGRQNEKRDRFLIAYEARQGASPTEFTVTKYETPKEDSGWYLFAAKAIDICLADFKGENRPYNVAALPADSNQMYVYVLPAQTKQGVYPVGGDARYLVSPDGSKIVEKRQLHKAIIEFESSGDQVAGFQTAVLDDIPEDTDVFLVLTRRPSVPQWLMTSKYVYQIEIDGTVKYVMTSEAFQKIPRK